MSKAFLEELLIPTGIRINGNNPWDIQIHNPQSYNRITRNHSLGAGESYMDGWWDCEALDQMFYRLCHHLDADTLPSKAKLLGFFIRSKLLNLQSIARSREVADKHYNLGNALYKSMLGETMAYTCGYYKNASTLDDAQIAKFDLVCRKLDLKTGERLLDLGCGWGTFAEHAAKHYGVEVVAVNIASEQIKYAQQRCLELPIQFVQADYRQAERYNPNQQPFDKVASIGLCEHIGDRNYPSLINIVSSQLKQSGLFLLHTICRNNALNYCDPWISRYIFPNARLPSTSLLSSVFESKFILEDYHNFGPDYDQTLMAWEQNFSHNWPTISSQYDQRFYRMWRYYLLSCAGAFRARDMQLCQFLLAPHGRQASTHNTVR